MDTVSYCIELCNDIRENGFDNRHCSCRISRKSSGPECTNMCCHMVLDDHTVRNCTRDSIANLSSIVFSCNAPTIVDVSSFSCSVTCCPDAPRTVCQLLPFERIRRPKQQIKLHSVRRINVMLVAFNISDLLTSLREHRLSDDTVIVQKDFV